MRETEFFFERESERKKRRERGNQKKRRKKEGKKKMFVRKRRNERKVSEQRKWNGECDVRENDAERGGRKERDSEKGES